MRGKILARIYATTKSKKPKSESKNSRCFTSLKVLTVSLPQRAKSFPLQEVNPSTGKCFKNIFDTMRNLASALPDEIYTKDYCEKVPFCNWGFLKSMSERYPLRVCVPKYCSWLAGVSSTKLLYVWVWRSDIPLKFDRLQCFWSLGLFTAQCKYFQPLVFVRIEVASTAHIDICKHLEKQLGLMKVICRTFDRQCRHDS